MSDIFICYSKVNRAIATRLGQRLRDDGWSVFMDVQTHVGKRWHKEIERELHAARAVVVLWSARSRESDFVLEEAAYARRKEILFPAFIEHVEFPYGFGLIQTADLIGWAGGADHPGLTELLESLREHLNSREQAEEERKHRAEAEAKRQAEEERKHRAEAEAKRQAEEERKRRAEAEVRRQAEIKASAQYKGTTEDKAARERRDQALERRARSDVSRKRPDRPIGANPGARAHRPRHYQDRPPDGVGANAATDT